MSESLVPVEYTSEQKSIMLETVARGCKPEQFLLMMELAKKYRLDPFARQIWATPMGIIIGRDGFLTLAHNSGNFDGMNTTFEERDGKLWAATCEVWHKKMSHPITFTARFDEFNKTGSEAWRKMPYTMLQKCAESHALRRAFSITGLYDEAELCDNPTTPEENPPIVDFTATVDGEPVNVQSMKKPEPARCTCGADPMLPGVRKAIQDGYDLNGFGPVPEKMCEACAKKHFKFLKDQMRAAADPQNPYGMKPRPAELEPDIIDYHGKKIKCVCKKCGARLNKNMVAARLIFNEKEFTCNKCDPKRGLDVA